MVRTGSGGERKARQVAVIPLRRDGRGLEVCLIRRKTAAKWGIPKGFIDRGETRKAAALKEAEEEAGLAGQIAGGCIGTYEYDKRGASYTVAVYLMEVDAQRRRWPEMRFRERRWVSVKDAASLLVKHPVRKLFDRVRAWDR
jgi:8-oxo-dGTP pyrophosphatase MutT (NUDIX family)